MATSFKPHVVALLLFISAGAAAASEVALIGVIGERAVVLSVDGGDPKMVKVSQTWNGITVLALDKNGATVQINGRTRVLVQGVHYGSAQAVQAEALSVRDSVAALALDNSGHFHAEASVNGVPVRFMVDTGASTVALPASVAKRLNIDYLSGVQSVAQTANGPVSVYRVSLASVKVGAVELRSVEGVVVEHGLETALLGMSFLKRVDMKVEGSTMTLTRRF